MASKIVNLRVPDFLKKKLDEVATAKHKTFTDVFLELTIKGLAHSDIELTPLEKQWVDIQLKAPQDSMLKDIRAKSAEKLFFLKNIKKQVYLFTRNRADIEKKDIINNMKLNLKIAQNNGWKNEEKKIKQFLKKIKAYDMSEISNAYDTVPVIEGGKDVKQIQEGEH